MIGVANSKYKNWEHACTYIFKEREYFSFWGAAPKMSNFKNEFSIQILQALLKFVREQSSKLCENLKNSRDHLLPILLPLYFDYAIDYASLLIVIRRHYFY